MNVSNGIPKTSIIAVAITISIPVGATSFFYSSLIVYQLKMINKAKKAYNKSLFLLLIAKLLRNVLLFYSVSILVAAIFWYLIEILKVELFIADCILAGFLFLIYSPLVENVVAAARKLNISMNVNEDPLNKSVLFRQGKQYECIIEIFY